jgi:hypothetical protein
MKFSVPIVHALQSTLQLPESFRDQTLRETNFNGHPVKVIGVISTIVQLQAND